MWKWGLALHVAIAFFSGTNVTQLITHNVTIRTLKTPGDDELSFLHCYQLPKNSSWQSATKSISSSVASSAKRSQTQSTQSFREGIISHVICEVRCNHFFELLHVTLHRISAGVSGNFAFGLFEHETTIHDFDPCAYFVCRLCDRPPAAAILNNKCILRMTNLRVSAYHHTKLWWYQRLPNRCKFLHHKDR